MIRINLSPTGQKAKKKASKISAIVAPPQDYGEGSSGLWLPVLLAVTATVTVNGYFYVRVKNEAVRIQAENAKANTEFARLTQVKLRYEEMEKEKDTYKRRVDVIDQLRASQSGPVALMKMLGDQVSRTNEVWLSRMEDDGTSIELRGIALSVHGVADLMRNLENTGYFKSVDIKSSYQDEKVQDMQAFIFELNCVKRAADGHEATAAPPAKS